MPRFPKPAPVSDEEDRAITKAARADPDNPPLTLKQMRKMRPAREVIPDIEEIAARTAAKRGRPKLDNPKIVITARLDADVVRALKAAGPGWQTRMNDILKRSVRAKTKQGAS